MPNSARMANPRAIKRARDQGGNNVAGVTAPQRAAIKELVVAAITEGWTFKMLARRFQADLDFDAARAASVARNEIRQAAIWGTIDSFIATNQATGSRIGKRVLRHPDECPLSCEAAVSEGPIALEASWSIGFAPPFHPECTCDVMPVLLPDNDWPRKPS
jgi:hypothetical protein